MKILETFKSFAGGRRTLMGTAAGIVVLGIILFLASRSSSHFATDFATYTKLAKEQERAAYIPAAPDNDVRQRLNMDLALSLEKNTKPADRLKYAKDGLEIQKQLEAQIDAIGSAAQKADTIVAQMQVESLKDFSTSGASRELIDLAKKRSSIIEDIRGLSYRADFETEKIFNRIIEDGGKLTDAHVGELNDEIPVVESQFDHRASLYEQLKRIGNQIDQKALALHLGSDLKNSE